MSTDQVRDTSKALRRNQISMQTIRGLSKQIVAQFHPEKIFLFGSYAHGTMTADSDVDMMVLMHTPLRNRQQAAEIARALHYHFGLDLMVRTPEQFQTRFELGDPFVRDIVQNGKVLYERAQP